MICNSCEHAVIQKTDKGDLDWQGRSVLREIFNCELISKEVVKLVECNRYLEIKEVEYNNKEKVTIEPVIFKDSPKKRGRPKKSGVSGG